MTFSRFAMVNIMTNNVEFYCFPSAWSHSTSNRKIEQPTKKYIENIVFQQVVSCLSFACISSASETEYALYQNTASHASCTTQETCLVLIRRVIHAHTSCSSVSISEGACSKKHVNHIALQS